jgi:hypothetical protein
MGRASTYSATVVSARPDHDYRQIAERSPTDSQTALLAHVIASPWAARVSSKRITARRVQPAMARPPGSADKRERPLYQDHAITRAGADATPRPALKYQAAFQTPKSVGDGDVKTGLAPPGPPGAMIAHSTGVKTGKRSAEAGTPVRGSRSGEKTKCGAPAFEVTPARTVAGVLSRLHEVSLCNAGSQGCAVRRLPLGSSCQTARAPRVVRSTFHT